MRKVIFTNRTDLLNNHWDWSTDQPLHCFLPKDTHQTEEVARFLHDRTGVRWVDRDRMFQKNRETFEQHYVQFMARLNVENHSFIWWTMNFTSKNPLATDLIFQVFCFLRVVELVRETDTDLLVITDDLYLCNQMRIWAKNHQIEVINDIRKKRDWKDWLRTLGPADLCRDLIRLALFHRWSKKICKWKPTPGLKYAAISSLINQQSFKKDGSYRDTYFGALQNYFREKGVPVFLYGKFIGAPWDYRKMTRHAAMQTDYLAVEYFLSYPTLIKCWFICLYYYFFNPKIHGPVSIQDCDVRYLAKQAVRDSFRHNTALFNMREYYSLQAMMKKIPLAGYFYPFENRSFEKMMVSGVQNMPFKIPTSGFQHAAVTHKHTNFLLSPEEIKITPLPDKIITLGRITRNLLIQMGNFPESKIKVGCALRQNPKQSRKIQPRSFQKVSNILVILSESVEEYVRTLTFLDRALQSNEGVAFTLRPHPTIPLEKALESCPPIHFSYIEQKGVSLDEALCTTDVIIYTSSTIGIDAISRGIPVVFLDLGDFLDPDPLFYLQTFKWKVQRPEKFWDAIREIEGLPDKEYKQAQIAAKSSADDYLVPVDEKQLLAFLGNLPCRS